MKQLSFFLSIIWISPLYTMIPAATSGPYHVPSLLHLARPKTFQALLRHADAISCHSPQAAIDQLCALRNKLPDDTWNTSYLSHTVYFRPAVLAALKQACTHPAMSKGIVSRCVPQSMHALITKRMNHTAKATRTLQEHTKEATSVCYSPDGTQLAFGSGKNINLWSLRIDETTRKIINQLDLSIDEIIHTLPGHANVVNSVCYGPDGTQIASGSYDHTIKLWDLVTGKILRTLQGHTNFVASVCYSPDGTQIASGSHDRTIQLWDPRTDQVTRTLKERFHTANSVCYSPDNTQIASGSCDCHIRIWDFRTGKMTHAIHESGGVNAVCYNPDGTQIASGLSKSSITLRDPQTGQATHTLQGHTEMVESVCYSPDGTQIASGSRDNTIKLWNPKTGRVTQTLQEHDHVVNSVCYSPDGTQLASSSWDETIKLWAVL